MSNLRRAKCWLITRRDGVEIASTDHDVSILFQGRTYIPRTISSSAIEKQALVPNNFDIHAAFGDISYDDLLAGKYFNALVDEFKVDWLHPLEALDAVRFIINSFQVNGEVFTASMVGVQSKIVGNAARFYTSLCPWDLYDPNTCQANPDEYREDGFITEIVEAGRSINININGFEENYFKYGTLKWVTGDNVGLLDRNIKTSSFDGFIEFQLKTGLGMQVGDTFELLPGCDKSQCHCLLKFNNELNYGGFPYIEGTDRMIQTPDGKS